MPINVADVLATEQKKPVERPPLPPKKAEPGLSVEDVLKAQPQQPSLLDRGKQVVSSTIERTAPLRAKVAFASGEAYSAAIKPYLDDYRDMVQDYKQALDEDAKRIPEGLAGHIVDQAKKINDLLGYYTTPIMAPIYTGIIKPLQSLVQQGGNMVKAHVADANYNAQKQREGVPYPKGAPGFAVNKADVQNFVDNLNAAIEGFVNAGVAFVGPKGGEIPREVTPERAAARARTALQDTTTAVKPPEPKLTVVKGDVAQDMGFHKVTQVTGETLRKLPVGSNLTTAAVLDDMLPHAEGYAKSFLEKLSKYADPNMPIKFLSRASMPGAQGQYIPEYHQVRVSTGMLASDTVQTTLHEIVHGTSVNMLDTLIDNDLKAAKAELGRDLTPAEKLSAINNPRSPILKELDGIIKEAKIRAQKAGRLGEHNIGYGILGAAFDQMKNADLEGTGLRTRGIRDIAFRRMSPRYEFLSEVFTNPVLQEFLANSEKYASFGYKWKNMLNQMGNLIGRHLGITDQRELRLLNQSMRVGSQLMKMQSELKPPSGRSIHQVIANLDDGGSMTRGDVKSVTEINRLIDPAGVRRARDSLKISLEQLMRGMAPEALGRNAKLAAAAIAQRITEQMQRESAWRFGSQARLKFWRARPDMAQEFIKKFEKGGAFSDPALADFARKYRDWGAKIADRDLRLGFSYEPRENYLAHIFEDAEGVSAYFMKKYGSKWGDPGFIKDRSFDLYEEAVAAGFRPRYDNPEDIMLARQHASDIAEMHIGILNDLASYGLAIRKVAAREELVKEVDSEGKVSFRVKKTPGTERPESYARWRAPNGDVFWVEPQADAILQNAFKSKSLWEDKGVAGSAFKGFMSLKNALVPIRLALSLFHPLHVLGIDMSAGMTRGLSGMLSGTVPAGKGLAEMLKSGLMYRPISELPGIRRLTKPLGWELMEAWKGRIPADKIKPETAAALKTLTEMGVAPEMSSRFRSNARANFMNALRDAQGSWRGGRPGGATTDVMRATWHLPWALISAMSKPIFEDWIPALKAASAIRDAKNLLQRNPELAENDAARLLAMRKLGKSVENRYGEMNYSTLFWKRWIKDVAVLDTLSLGWQLGFLREYGGGAMDLGQWALSGDKLQKIRKGDMDRAIFVAAYTTLGAGVSGLMTYGMTGKPPTELLDYISPKTGETNPDGTPQRVSTMFYSREFASLYKHMQNEGAVPGLSELVLNKGSGLFGLMHEWTTGINSWGEHIRDPDADAFTKLEQTLAYSLSDLEPISMKAIQENVTDQPLKQGVLTALGFTPAPKYLTETKTDASIKAAFRAYVNPKETPYERAEYSKDYTMLRNAYQTGSDKYGEILDKMVAQYELSGKDQRRLIRSLNSQLTGTQRMFMRLPWQEQIKVLDKATPDEVAELLPHANREHVRNVWQPKEAE